MSGLNLRRSSKMCGVNFINLASGDTYQNARCLQCSSQCRGRTRFYSAPICTQSRPS
ncbi:hypothetical protein [uncultured Campylobacter sp.]|uniref:hypothetical protein n=1 Tax=uncultured Campylobacter sp. TaxID=218934 RepID=UPI002620E775|nr:hypothetical protein [uncultured Campylobacter sp.]